MKTQIKTKTWDEVRKTARRILPIACLLSICGGIAINNNTYAESTAWGPERSTFTWEKPATYPTINSITDNPDLGDERNFVRIRKADTDDKYSDDVTAEVGAEYEVYVFFHNNASTDYNKDGSGIARAVHLNIEYPEVINAGESAKVKGTITASNTNPGSVWDTTYINAKDTVYLRYVPNSAVIHSQGDINGQILPDSALYGKGSYLGYYLKYWGVLPGCNQYAGYVTFRIKIDKPGFYMEKTASKDGANQYGEAITVAPGDTIDFKIRYHNTGTTVQNDILAYDKLADGMEVVPGTTYLETPTTKGFENDNLFSGGLVIGDYSADQQAYLTYKVKIKDDATMFPCGETVIYNNSAVATNNGTEHDAVKVTVKRDCGSTTTTTPTTTPTTPGELPNTGPTEIMLAAVVVIAISIVVGYYVASNKQLHKLEKSSK